MVILISKSVQGKNQMSSDRCWRELSSSLVIWKLGRVNGLLLAIPMQVYPEYPLFNAYRPIRKGLLKRIFRNSIRARLAAKIHTPKGGDTSEGRCLSGSARRDVPASICIVSRTLYSISKVCMKRVSGRKGSLGFKSMRCASIFLRLFFATPRQVGTRENYFTHNKIISFDYLLVKKNALKKYP